MIEAYFDTCGHDSELKWRDWSRCTVIRALTEAEADIADVGPMYRVRFLDGEETDAFADELHTIVMQECERCGRRFRVEYCADGTYRYVDDPCECEADFCAVDGPALAEWINDLENLRKEA